MDIIRETYYKALDLLTPGEGVQRQIGGIDVRFPAKWSRYYESDYEPETFTFFRKYLRPGSNVLDIGAHIGLFAVVTAKIVGKSGKVFSFEPTPFTRKVLTDVVQLNGCSDIVEVRGEALSYKAGKAVFFDTGTEISNANSLVKTERSRGQFEVDLVSIDEFVSVQNRAIDCLKIDVEGAELDVLKGGRETFLTTRPVARLGLHPPAISQNGQTLDEIWDILQSYRLRIEFGGEPVEQSWFCNQLEIFDVTLLPN